MESLETAIRASRQRRELPSPGARRALREKAGISQGAVARAVGVSRSAISRYESGRRTPAGEQLRRYAQVLERLAAEEAER